MSVNTLTYLLTYLYLALLCTGMEVHTYLHTNKMLATDAIQWSAIVLSTVDTFVRGRFLSYIGRFGRGLYPG